MASPPYDNSGPRMLRRHGSDSLPKLLGGYPAITQALACNDQLCPVVLFCFTSPRREVGERERAVCRDDQDDHEGRESAQ